MSDSVHVVNQCADTVRVSLRGGSSLSAYNRRFASCAKRALHLWTYGMEHKWLDTAFVLVLQHVSKVECCVLHRVLRCICRCFAKQRNEDKVKPKHATNKTWNNAKPEAKQHKAQRIIFAKQKLWTQKAARSHPFTLGMHHNYGNSRNLKMLQYIYGTRRGRSARILIEVSIVINA